MRKGFRVQPLHVVLYGCMITLLTFSLCYYKLRIFSDTAGYLTDITRNGGFAIAHNRFVSVINQLLPVALLKANASLKAITIAYSFNYTLAPVALSLLCLHWLKRPYHAVAMMLLAVLMNVLLFYYAVSEMQMGLFVFVFYDAIADDAQESGSWKGFAILTLLIVPILAFSHPMVLLAFAGWLAYRLLKDPADYRRATLATACFIAASIIKKIWFTSTYESEKTLTWEKVRPFGLNYYGGPFARSIYRYILDDTFMVLVVLLSTIALLLWIRKYRLLGFLILAVAGIFTLVLINFEDWVGHFYDHYYEHMLQPAIFLLVLVFCYALKNVPGREWQKAGLLTIVFVISLAKISSGSEQHVARQRWIYGYLELMDQLRLKKAVAGRIWVPDGMVRGSFWSSSWETLILSSLDGPERSKTLFMSWDINRINEPVQATDEFVTDSWSFKQSSLPKTYFSLGDKPYVILETVVPDSVLEHLRWR